jgi:hypothetical protein
MTEVYHLPEDEEDDRRARQRWQWREQVGYVFFYEWRQLCRLRLASSDWRVWCALVGNCTWQNACPVTGAALGRATQLTAAQVSRSLRRLRDCSLIVPDIDAAGEQHGFRLNPAYVWKGRPWGRQAARLDYDARLRLWTDQRDAEQAPAH